MYFQNSLRPRSIIILIFILAIIFPANIPGQALEQTTSKGLRTNLIKDPSLMFIHAEIVIYYSEISDPAVPYLTLMNIFDAQINNPQSGLLNILFKMGNDVEIDYKLDHLIIKINFLPADVNQFVNFLKSLYNYRGFSLKKFNYSIKNFWDLFTKKNEWKRIIAAQIAFNRLFNQDHPEQFLLPGKKLGRLNLSHIRSFHKKNYTLPNSYLTVQGDINPYVLFGLIEKAFRNFKNLKASYSQFRYDHYKSDRKVIIVDDGSNGNPIIYWIDPLPPSDNIDHHHNRIINNILFGYPLGRISRSASSSGIKNFNISWVIHHHRNISVVCKKIRVGYRDIEKFIMIADNAISKLGVGRISRKEYLDSYNYVFQKERIDSDNYEMKAGEKIARSFSGKKVKESKTGQKNPLKELSYEDFSRILSDPSGSYNVNRNKKKGIIIIFGNPSLVKKYLRNIKPEIIKIR